MQRTTPDKPAAEYDGQRDMDAFWAAARPKSEPTRRRWYIPTLLLLVVLSVPWYRAAGSMGELILGMPAWIWTSLACTAGVSALTAFGILRYWRDED